MSTLLIILLLPLSVFLEHPADPAPGPWQSKEESRNLECLRLTQQQAHELRPDQVPEPFARGDFALTDALACRRRYLALGERPARDEVILSTLRQSVGEITRQASSGGLDKMTWHVDAFYPEPGVASKISVAARTDLAERGEKVSDRVPLLAAGDLVVLGRLAPREAYPLACARYFAQQALGEEDALLGLMILDPREAQLESLRAQVAGQIQLQAYDLLDELVFGWTQKPPFALDTPVVLAEVSVPVGFGSGLQALIENHFAGLITQTPKSRVILSHCPQCTSLVVHSGAKGTIVSRGVDLPEALGQAGALSGARHALFLDFEVEGSSLVLRARITSLEPALPIVHARTLSTSTSAPALLRTGERLKSADEARQDYLDALTGRGLLLVPVRLGVRSYASKDDGAAAAMAAPMVWLQAGIEASLTQARAWTGSFSVGATWMPELHTGWMFQGRLARLLSGTETSLTRPDLYGFVGGSMISIHGMSALAFSEDVPTTENLLAGLAGSQATGLEPHAAFAAFQVGLELRVKNRIGVSAYLETHPSFDNLPAIGSYVDLDLVQFESFGAEVSFCF